MSHTSTNRAGPLPLDGEALAELGHRARAIARTLTDRVVVEQRRHAGDPAVRAEASQEPFVTVQIGPGHDAPDASLRITELASLAELAAATADAQSNAAAGGWRGASVVHVVPDTMVRDSRQEYTGGTQVTGAWIQPGDKLAPSAGFSRLSVTLTHTSHRYLASVVPVAGELHVHEVSVDGRIIAAGFRQLLPGGKLGTEVAVSDVGFSYRP